ncbi:MAG TPA: phosphomannomutase/phosphoglucomutase [Gammaproteobacteria bacterium]|jgi:phosphomannomutase/phosphoglucomutase|nr:phosphomannomutase/phosphoglucomutase [Gammaproteobacteria bacterium]HIK73047.1 phosphomannomutase/phosphoglucomutase [Gammaproteobacteria bacterium]
MTLNKNIFRANDIRGIAYEDLNEDVVVGLGKALGSLTLKSDGNEFLVGRDGRNSSPDMFKWLTRGIMQSGCNVINIGIVPSPVLYFATHKLDCSNGVIITGSHNPSEYNGFKIIINEKSLLSNEIQLIKTIIEKELFEKGLGSIRDISILEEYQQNIINDISLKRPLKIAIDCGNGAGSVHAKDTFEKLGCKVHDLYCELDGDFPNHHPDPSRPENLKDLIDLVVGSNLDIGLAFDGDADRLGVISPSGEIIYPDMQMIIFSENILNSSPNSKIVFDVKCSNLLSESITQKNGIPIMCKTGHTFIKEAIRNESALLGGEMSGHIFFNDRWPGFDDGIYAAARLLEIISERKESNYLFDKLPHLCSTPEINLYSSDDEKFKIVESFKKTYNFPEANLIDIDGVRLEFPDGWGLLRASNTSPVLVLRFEANSEEALDHIKHKFKQVLEEIKYNFEDF